MALPAEHTRAAHWRGRLEDALAHDLGLVVAKAVYGELAVGAS